MLGRRYFGIYLLITIIMGAGILLTYQAMVKTTGWPVPPLVHWQNAATYWELEAVGLKYTVNKEDVQPVRLKARAQLIVEGLVEWSEPFLQEGLEMLQDAADLVLERLTGE